jgi:hypothetical protein
VNSASIEVNRRARRAKTDRLDSDKLLSMLMRYYAGERRVWAVARIPTPEQEDDRRLHRELERLRKEQDRAHQPDPFPAGTAQPSGPVCRRPHLDALVDPSARVAGARSARRD